MASPNDLNAINAAIAQQGAGWQARDNPISRLPRAEQLMRLGVTPPEGAPSINDAEKIQAPAHGASVGAPSSFDLRNVSGKNYVTPVRDQRSCGSCVAFGTLAAVEATLAFRHGTVNPRQYLSVAHLFFCYGAADGAACAKGYWPPQALSHCVSPGVVDDDCFPYTPEDQPCKLCSNWQTRLTKISGFADITGNVSLMKQWISAKGALSACFIVYDDFFYYSSGIYKHVSQNKVGGHCIAIVGYNDTDKCWICKNSWRDNWGEAGFFRIGYGECAIETWNVCDMDV